MDWGFNKSNPKAVFVKDLKPMTKTVFNQWQHFVFHIYQNKSFYPYNCENCMKKQYVKKGWETARHNFARQSDIVFP